MSSLERHQELAVEVAAGGASLHMSVWSSTQTIIFIFWLVYVVK